jgi:thioredoxin 1
MTFVYILIGLVIVFFAFQYLMVIKAKFKKGKPAPELSGSLNTAVQKYDKVLIYFFSPSCGACRSMTPLIEEYKRKKKNFFSIDVSRDSETAGKFGIMATPSTVIVEKGTIREFLLGPIPKGRIDALMA